MSQNKIVEVEKLAEIVASAKKAGKKVVHCHGVFDLLHIGHIRYFKQARDMGDMLVVTVTPDRFVDKGPNRPAFTEALRLEAIASVYCVDYVAANKWPTAEETLRLLRPDIYVKGSEFRNVESDITGKIGREAEVIKEIGATLMFTDDIVFSSSNLINTHLSVFNEEVKSYLDVFKTRYPLNNVLGVIENLSKLKVLVVGDTILDAYVYCEAIGKSSKDPVLAMRHQSREMFAGGILAVANHVAGFAGSVDVFSVLGSEHTHEEFVMSSLGPRIRSHFFRQPEAPTIVKQRFIESYALQKMIEIYYMDERPLPEEVVDAMIARLKEIIGGYDVVIVADYGHGAVPQPVKDFLGAKAKFLVVNTQANAGNRGFNTITQYKRVDFGCLAEHEIRLECRNPRGELRPMMESIGPRLGAKYFVVTRGKKGASIWTSSDDFVSVPAFATKIVDRVGAGDAFLSVAGLAAAQEAPPEVIGFIGNVVGAQAVEIIGNKKAIDKMKVVKHIMAMLK